jgi:hypothetical protein
MSNDASGARSSLAPCISSPYKQDSTVANPRTMTSQESRSSGLFAEKEGAVSFYKVDEEPST